MIIKFPIILLIIALIYYFFKDEVFTQKEIKIGTSLPKTGIIKSWGESVIMGANAYFNYVNENKILKDKTINFISYDDKYEPELTIDNLNKLIYEDKVFALFGFVGTPTIKNILPILQEEEIPFFAPFTGASFLRDNKNPNILNFRTSYDVEVESLVDYLYKVKKIKEIAVFYQNDDYGEEGYVSLLKSLEKRNLSLVAEGSYKRNTLSISHAFNEIKDAKPQAIIMIGAYKSNSLFIKKAKENENFKDTIFCNISFGDANAMINELKKLNIDTKNLLFSQIVPSYSDTSIEVVKEYQTLMKRYYPNEKLGFISLEAFLASKVLVDSIGKIKGERTRNKLNYTLKTVDENLLKGLKLHYKNNQLLNKSYLFEYKQEEFKEIK